MLRKKEYSQIELPTKALCNLLAMAALEDVHAECSECMDPSPVFVRFAGERQHSG